MGVLFSHYKNSIIPVKAITIAVLLLLTSALTSLVMSPAANAADAAWTTSSRDAISYGGKTFTGPKTNTKAPGDMAHSGWNPSGDGQDGATFYSLGTEAVIWFPKGTATGSAESANYAKLKTIGTNVYAIDGASTPISIGLDQTEASLSVVRSIYKNSISDYINSECSKPPFTSSNEQRECRDIVNKRFDTCWNGQVNDNSFTFNSSKPGDSIRLDNLASCVVSGTDVGNAPTYRKYLQDAQNKANQDGADAFNNAQPTGEIPEDGDTGASCRIDGIGWIICPVITITAGIIDGAYGVVSLLLGVQPLTTTGDTQPIFEAWSIMRNFANVSFVIAFLVIVFSQVTGVGVSNYGIKKLIPRLIFAAIFVNISYWVCAIAVDISNIAGASLKGIFDNLGGTIASPDSGIFSGDSPWWNAAGFILAGGVAAGIALYTTLAALLPALVAVLAAIVTVFLVLTLRQALIILLIVISPLAFVAFLLPNTQGWFNKWRQLFQTLLLMYPIIAVIFGASAFASEIIMKGAGKNVALQIMGAAVSIVPLAITPVVMKTAGGLLNRFAGVVNNPNKGPIDKLRRSAEGLRDHRQAIAKNSRISRGERFRNGQMFNGKLGSKLYGKEGSYRRRGMAALGAYGRNQRELGRKDVAAGLEAGNEQVYLRSDAGSAKRQASTNASIELQNTKTNVETARLASEAGVALTQATTQADLEKKIAENIGQTKAKVNVPVDLQMQAMATSDDLKAVDTDYGQLYEEIKVQNPDANAPKHALYNQVSADTMTLAQDAQRKSDIANDATNSAKRVQRLEYAEAINASPRRAGMAGGIDPYGSQRAVAQATSTVVNAQTEAVKNEKLTMSNESTTSLAAIRDDTNNSVERRMAAVSKLVDAASVGDVIKQMDNYGAQLQAAQASGNVQEAKAIHELQQQFFSDAASAGKLPKSMTGPSKGAMSTGEFTGSFEQEVLTKFKDGAYSGEFLANLSPHEVKAISGVISANAPSFAASPHAAAYAQASSDLKVSIDDYSTASRSLGKSPAPEIANEMETIKISI